MKQKWLMSVTLAAMLLCGCGSSHGSSGSYATEQAYDGGSAGGSGYMASYNAKDADGDYSNMAEVEAPREDGNGTAPVTDPVLSQEKLVYTGNLTIQSLEYDESITALKNKIKEYGGIIEWENESDSNYRWYDSDYSGSRTLNMTVRIPTENFEAFMNDAGGVGKVISRTTGVENISRQYNDTTVQIEALEKQQERLLEMMDKAETIEDMIMVESRLTEVQSQLNQLRTYRQSMDTDVMYSTVSLSLQEVKEYVHVNESFFERAWNSFVDGWKNFLWFLEDFTIEILYALPYLLIAAVAIWLGGKSKVLQKIRLPRFLRWNKKDKDNSSTDES